MLVKRFFSLLILNMFGVGLPLFSHCIMGYPFMVTDSLTRGMSGGSWGPSFLLQLMDAFYQGLM